MANVEINDLTSLGVIRDVEPFQLPPEAFSFGENVRFTDEGVERLAGATQVFGTPGVAPHFAMPISSAAQTYWLYTSLTKGYVFDGTTHTNITRQTLGSDVDYTAAQTRDWNGTLLGGVPILNNGVDTPQYWAAFDSAGTKLAALPNWPSGGTARVLRSFGPYLIALDVTLSGTRYPHLVKWSHPADPGSVPSSWDHADETVDAGQKDLPDVNAGIILDGLPLRGSFFVYKEGSVWRMNLIGGRFIFSFDSLLETSGLLAPRCVTITGDGTRHVFASQDDILVHDGNSVESVLDNRFKKYLFNQIDITNFLNCFMFTNPFKNEIWFCYPESGQTNPTRAIIWNYKEGRKGALSEADVSFRNAAQGIIETASTDTWSSVTPTWDTVTGPWSQSNRRRVVLCGTDDTKFYELDTGTTFGGTTITGTLRREGLALVGRKRSGEWIVDFKARKFVRRLWVKATGGPINVRVGTQFQPEGAITWSAAQSFDPDTQKYLDFALSGAAISIEFEASVPFRILGYKLEGSVAGSALGA